MIQASYTAAASAAFVNKPQDRVAGIRALFEKAGGKFECLDYCLGDYGLVVQGTLPDDTAATAIALAVTGAGHISRYRTQRLLSAEEFMSVQKLAARADLPGAEPELSARHPLRRSAPCFGGGGWFQEAGGNCESMSPGRTGAAHSRRPRVVGEAHASLPRRRAGTNRGRGPLRTLTIHSPEFVVQHGVDRIVRRITKDMSSLPIYRIPRNALAKVCGSSGKTSCSMT
jgi:uncharacterized protein with GYD domain